MSRRLALVATAAVLVPAMTLAAATPAWAIFGRRKPAEPPPAAQTARPAPGQPQGAAAATAPAGPRKATPEQRAQAERLDPLARAAFWGREVEVDPADAEAGVKLAAALRALNQPQQAAAAAERVLIVNPDHLEALLELGRAHIARGQGFYAVQHLKKAETLAPRDWRPLNLLGVAYDQTQRTAEARQVWERALQLSPDNPNILANKALSLAASGDLTQAEALLRRAVARPGATLQTRQNLALVLGLQGKTAEAEQWLRQDLPPEMANANLQWLKKASAAPRGSGAAPTAASPRSWDSLRAGGN